MNYDWRIFMTLPKFIQSALNTLSEAQTDVLDAMSEQRDKFILTRNRKALVRLCDSILPRDADGEREFERYGCHGVHLQHQDIDIYFNRYIRGDAIYIAKDGVIVGSWADQSAAYSGMLGENDVRISSALTHHDIKPFLDHANIKSLIVKMGETNLGENDNLGDVFNQNKFKAAASSSVVFSAFPQHNRQRLESDLSL
jgi:hypothetical protein